VPAVPATTADLINHPLTVQGFGSGDTLDLTNLPFASTTQSSSFNAGTEILKIMHGATTVQLGFTSAAAETFTLSSNGHGGTDVTLQSSPAAHEMSGHGFSSHSFSDHGIAHANVMLR
jgi:hypothetical protein